MHDRFSLCNSGSGVPKGAMQVRFIELPFLDIGLQFNSRMKNRTATRPNSDIVHVSSALMNSTIDPESRH
jgi:hypothetical protein